MLQDADEAAFRHMEANPYEFPVSNLDWVHDHLCKQLSGGTDSLKAACQYFVFLGSFFSLSFRAFDSENTGFISSQQFRDALDTLKVDIIEHVQYNHSILFIYVGENHSRS